MLKTPPLDTPVLPGIARGVVLELARQADVEVLEGPLSIDDLLDADEVLLKCPTKYEEGVPDQAEEL